MSNLDIKKDKILRQLIALKKSELIKIAAEFKPPIELKKSANGRQIAFAIRRRQLQDNPPPGSSQGDPKDRQQNTEFEQAVSDIPLSDQPPKDKRGGQRPGAGRPQGSTTEHVHIKRVMEIAQPNETIKGAYEILFALATMKLTPLATVLTPERAAELSLPATKLCEFYYKDQIPEELLIWLEFGVGHAVLLTEIVQVLRDIRSGKIKVNEQSKQQNSDRQDGQRQDSESPKPDQQN